MAGLSPPPPPTPTTSHFQGRAAPARRDNGLRVNVGSFPCLNVCRHLVKCLRPSFQRTIPPHRCVCLSRQSQIRRGCSLFKSQECKTGAAGKVGANSTGPRNPVLLLSHPLSRKRPDLSQREGEVKRLVGVLSTFK
jgi:hypothetical protein